MADELERRFIKIRVGDSRCASEIREAGVTATHIYLLRERTDCSHWKHIAPYFMRPTTGRHIVLEPKAARRYFTLQPKKVIAAMKKQGVW
jgi:hypothetical protein